MVWLTTVVLFAPTEDYEFRDVFSCTDSQVTLAWLEAVEKDFNVFVQAQAAEIRKRLSPEVRYYFKSDDNPANIITRKSSLLKLSENKLWWNGPSYLYSQDKNLGKRVL